MRPESGLISHRPRLSGGGGHPGGGCRGDGGRVDGLGTGEHEREQQRNRVAGSHRVVADHERHGDAGGSLGDREVAEVADGLIASDQRLLDDLECREGDAVGQLAGLLQQVVRATCRQGAVAGSAKASNARWTAAGSPAVTLSVSCVLPSGATNLTSASSSSAGSSSSAFSSAHSGASKAGSSSLSSSSESVGQRPAGKIGLGQQGCCCPCLVGVRRFGRSHGGRGGRFRSSSSGVRGGRGGVDARRWRVPTAQPQPRYRVESELDAASGLETCVESEPSSSPQLANKSAADRVLQWAWRASWGGLRDCVLRRTRGQASLEP